jgi:hypothetical protein
VKVAVAGLVMLGASLLVRVKAWVAVPALLVAVRVSG